MGPHRKHCIEHQHALLRPFYQIAVVRDPASQVIVELLVDIHKGRRHRHAFPDGKAQPVSLPTL